MSLSPEDLLLLLAAEANRRGLLVPDIRSEPALHSAERLLRVVGITPSSPPRALMPGVQAHRPDNTQTQLLPLYPDTSGSRYQAGRAKP